MRRLVATFILELSAWTTFLLLLIGSSLRAAGRRNIPLRGPALIIANHQSFIDPPAIGIASTRRRFHFLARKTLFKPGAMTWYLRILKCVPIDQDGVGKEGMKQTLARLEAGHAVVVFPEGERSVDGAIRAFRPGIGLLVKRARVPIVPVGIAGAFDAWPRFKHFPVPAPLFLPPTQRTIAVVYGKPRDPATLDGLSREEMLAVLQADVAAAWKAAEALRRKAAPAKRRKSAVESNAFHQV